MSKKADLPPIPPVPPEAGRSAAAPAPAAAPVVVPLGPQIPRRALWLDVPEYPGFTVQVWANYPQRLRREMVGEDADAAVDAYRQVILAHNGWRDFDGEPYPPPSEDGFWQAIPDELAATLMRLVLHTAWRQLPNALGARSSNS